MIRQLWLDWGVYLELGGFVMWPLVVLTVVLWFSLGNRLFLLNRGSKSDIRKLLIQYESTTLRPKGFIDAAVAAALKVREHSSGNIRHLLDDELFGITEKMGRYRTIIRTIVMIAPLAGLLGTVIGMIEMFESLGSQTFYSQNGGIANGISQALFTTQFGLLIAIPGMILGRLLDRKENKMRDEIEQLKDLICTKEEAAA